MNVAISPTAEALIQQLLDSGHDTPEHIIEEALEYFCSQQKIDTTLGFPDLTETEMIEANEKRWQTFQENPNGIPHDQVENWFNQRNKTA